MQGSRAPRVQATTARGRRERASSEGRLQAGGSKLTARSAGSRRSPGPERTPTDRRRVQRFPDALRNSPNPRRRVILVPLSHLGSGDGPDPRSHSQSVGNADSNPQPGQGHRAFLGGSDPGLPARRVPKARPARPADPAAEARGAGASGSLSKRRNSSPPAL